jgi:heme/copper-type cytochrome/quinol oxidase subunit 4
MNVLAKKGTNYVFTLPLIKKLVDLGMFTHMGQKMKRKTNLLLKLQWLWLIFGVVIMRKSNNKVMRRTWWWTIYTLTRMLWTTM